MFHKMMTAAVTPRVESGMVAAEYAVGTVASTGLAGILVWLAKQDWFREGISSIFKMIFKWV
ncbi:DUF4244 domain-containing protein [Trueperella sp. LYQ143]|uniref:DUF4244 domain-containing protein n=1 Tax=unclassified Trueperella TaxID=2630174 RepID=UPI0039837D72